MKRTWVSGTLLAGLAMALLLGTARTSVAQEIVGLTAVESQEVASLIFDLGDGNSVLLSLKDGKVLLGGAEVARYAEGGSFEKQWRALVERADLGITEVLERLVEFELVEGSSDEYAGVEAMKGAVARFQQVAEETGGQYMIGIPAAASWGEFEYMAGGDTDRVEMGVKQEEYVQAAVDAVKPYHQFPHYIGVSLWHMSDPEKDFEEPEKATRRTKFPNIIRESVWKILEDY